MPLEKVHDKIIVYSRDLEIENKKDANNEVDLLLEVDEEKINVEISTEMSQGIKDRNVVFLSKIHSKNLEYGMENYTKIHPSLQINLVSHNINKEKMIDSYYLRNDDNEILTKKYRIDYIDMAKATKICYNEGTREEKIRKWSLIFMTNKKEEFEKTLKESDIMSDIAKRKLSGDINKLSTDKEAVVIYTKLGKREMEHNTIVEEAKMAKEEGYKSGREEGFQQGIKQGMEKGMEQNSILVAKKLLNMKMCMEDISEVTGLSIDVIEKLK